MTGSKTKLLFGSLVLLALYLWRLALVKQPSLWSDQPVRVTGRISRQPYLTGSKQIIYLDSFLITTTRFPSYFYGQEIEVVGIPETRVLGPLKKQIVFNYPTIHLLKTTESWLKKADWQRILFNFRGRLEKLFCRLLPEPEASLLNGILLGAKQTLPQNFFQNLQQTGTLHVVVASGFNLTVVAGFLMKLLAGRVTRKAVLLIAFWGVVSYTLLVGADPPVVRAAIMVSFGFFAQVLGREKDAVTALVAAAVLMLFANPLILFDIGFQLSFLATAGLLLVTPCLKSQLFNFPFLGEALKTTLAAQVTTWPVILLNFGQVSFVSPLINALVLAVIPLTMVLGAVTGFLSFFSTQLAQLTAWLAWVPLTYFVRVINWFGQQAWVVQSGIVLPTWWLLLYYLFLFLWLLRKSKSFLSV